MRYLALALMLLPVATAFEMPDLAAAKESYNANIDAVLGFVKKLAGTERANVYIALADGSDLELSAVTKDGMIEELSTGELTDPTVTVRTSAATIDAITAAENKQQRLKQALDEKEITIEPVGAWKKIKWGFGKFGLKVASWFGK